MAADGDRLYTMYGPLRLLAVLRRSEEKVVAGLDASTGKTVWAHHYASSTGNAIFTEGPDLMRGH